MNDLKNSSNGLLVLKCNKALTVYEVTDLTEQITPMADKLGVEPLVLPLGFDVELKIGSEELLLRVCEALEKIAAQGEAPDVHVADIAPQALNARPSSLNSREPIYDGQNGNGYQAKASTCSDPLWDLPVPPKGR